MGRMLEQCFRLAQELLDAEQTSAPMPKVSPEKMMRELDLALPRQGRSEEEVFAQMREVLAFTPQTSNRRFFNQLFAGRVEMAGAAEVLSGLLNLSMYTFKVAGPHILIEHQLVRRMAALAGWPEGGGTFVPGGSMANLVGMILARNQAAPHFRDHGGEGQRLMVYMSAEGHYSVTKNAGMLGFGRHQVRHVRSDRQGRMDVQALEQAIGQDLAAGAIPCVVVATAGTTVRGAFDPLRAIAEVCERHQAWLHVDGALGGGLVLHPEWRAKLDGLELADSFTWDAHKAMGIPLICSAILVKRPELLAQNFRESADYLFQADSDHLNPGTKSIQCGRRNDAFKLWAAWQHLGDEGWAERIDRQVALAEYAANRLEQHPRIQLCEPPHSFTVCFEVAGKSSAEICDVLHQRGDAVIGYGRYEERYVLRLVTVNPLVSHDEIDRLIEKVDEVAAALPDHAPASSSAR